MVHDVESSGAAMPGIAHAAWWRAHGGHFAIAATVVAVIVVIAGWVTGLRDIMHGALLSFAIAALLPFVIIGAGVALILLVLVIGALAAALGEAAPAGESVEAGAGLMEGGARLIPKYYAFLARRKHPVFWGVGAGVLLGGIALWAFLAVVVVGGETRTTDTLTEARAAIELHYAKHGRLPQPDGEHRLVIDGRAFEDGFGRPLEFRVRGAWKVATWQLRSAGYDAEPSGDDLCVDGGTPAMLRIQQAVELLELSRRTRSIATRLESVKAMRCDQ